MSMDTNTTRRSLLRLGTGALACGAGAAAVAGGVALAGEAKSAAPSPDRRAWDRTMTAYNKAAATFAVTDRLHDQVYAAWRADAPTTDAIDLAEFWPMTAAQVARMDPDKYERERFASGAWFPTEAEAARFRAAVESVREYHRQIAAGEQRHGMDAISERHDADCNVMCDLEAELMAMAAPDIAAVAWKLGRILSPDDEGLTASYKHSYVQPVLADVRRLSGGEA
jgi:hypothetical protein